METGKFIKIFFLTLVGTLAVPIFVSAYSDATTHPALTQEAIKLFNNSYPDLKISDADKNLMERGSVEEDAAPKWMSHFYDPIYNRGLWANDSSKVYSQKWVTLGPGEAHVRPLSLNGQYTWQRAIYDYTYGDKKYAATALGHILHLIEDAAVPDHTRNDAHPPLFDQASPYEGWAAQFNKSNINVADAMITKKESPIILNSLDEHFDELASYSNKNFFSRDTILSENYDDPQPSGIKTILDRNFLTKDKIVLAERIVSLNVETQDYEYIYFLQDTDHLVVSSYWSHLAPQAVKHAAGVIKLFFDEVEKEKQTGVLLARNKSQTELAAEKIKSMASAASSFLKNAFTFSVPRSYIASTVAELPEEVIAQINSQPITRTSSSIETKNSNETISAGNTSAQSSVTAKPVIEKIISSSSSDNTQTPATSTPPKASLSNLFSVSTPYNLLVTGAPVTPIVAITEVATTSVTTNENSTSTPLAETPTNATSTPNETATSTEPTIPPLAPNETSSTTPDIIATSTEETIPQPPPAPTPEEIAAAMPVVINEVAWMGTSASTASDEWVELYNRSNADINLDGWILHSQTDMKPYINLTGTIAAKGYYLIERGGDDETISNITADWKGAFGSGAGVGLGNGGESLVLSYASTTIDETGLANGKWPAGSASEYASMERVDPNISGAEITNWARSAYPRFIVNGKTSAGAGVWGTPKARNSVNYLINDNRQDVTADIILKKENSPYVVSSTWLILRDGATLTIEPGVVIKFYGFSGIKAEGGKILAQGSAEEKIIFTSLYDDEHGGDTDGAPNAGQWSEYNGWLGIEVRQPGSVFDHTIIRSGGNGAPSPMLSNTALYVSNAPITFSNSTIEFSQKYGMILANSTSTIENNIFYKNNNPAERESTALLTSGGEVKILSNNFLDNTTGLQINYSTGIVDGNNFEGNGTNLKTYDARVSFTNNVGIENDPPPIILPEENI